MDLSLVIPAYNEGAIIKDTVSRAQAVLSEKFDSFEIIIADDGSTDKTREIVSSMTGGSVRLIACGENKGKGSAVRRGMLAAQGEFLFFTDADLAYGLDIIETGAGLLMDTGADIVAGSRRLDSGGYGDYPPIRLLASRCFSLVLRAASGMEYDTQCGVKGFRRHAAMDIFKSCVINGFSFDYEVMLLAASRGYRIIEMPARIISHRPTRLSLTREGFKMLGEIAQIRRGVQKSAERPLQ